MRIAVCLLTIFLAVSSAKAACMDVSAGSPQVILVGNVSKQVFPGPPNYESVANGDMPEQAWILLLDAPICIDDKGEFAEPALQFDTAQVYSTLDPINAQLSRLVGARVRIIGHGFASHTGHHHAPLVVELTQISKL